MNKTKFLIKFSKQGVIGRFRRKFVEISFKHFVDDRPETSLPEGCVHVFTTGFLRRWAM